MLRQLIKEFPENLDSHVIVGPKTSDDAGVYQISDDLALVQTVDFFTPIVDDPYIFGQIAAANALSDVYAMGGTPLTALNISAFPNHFPITLLTEILKGGHDKAKEAGTVVLGGHTVQDEELKYGMAVTGTIHPKKVYTNQGAKSGDSLILTKPLGTGILTTALKKKKLSKESTEEICFWMSLLNKSAADSLSKFQVHACTDITGFGLSGHAFQLARESKVGLRIEVQNLPHYPEALYFAKKGVRTGADKTNREYVSQNVECEKPIPDEWFSLIHDPQTSGGLFISLPRDEAYPLLKELHSKGLKYSRIVGEVFSSSYPKLFFA